MAPNAEALHFGLYAHMPLERSFISIPICVNTPRAGEVRPALII